VQEGSELHLFADSSAQQNVNNTSPRTPYLPPFIIVITLSLAVSEPALCAQTFEVDLRLAQGREDPWNVSMDHPLGH
jgi:hypothetical protein